ncbi:hypothetical protein JCM1841_004172 [Sporobolomyces salmonicolor]
MPFRAFDTHLDFPQQRPQQHAVSPRSVVPTADDPRPVSLSPLPSLDIVSTQDVKAGSSFGGFDDLNVGENEGSGRKLRKPAAIWFVVLAAIIAIYVGAGVGVLVRPRLFDEFSFFRLCRLLHHFLRRFARSYSFQLNYDPLSFDHVFRPLDHVFWPFELNPLVFHLYLYLEPPFHFSKVGNPGQDRHHQRLYLHHPI